MLSITTMCASLVKMKIISTADSMEVLFPEWSKLPQAIGNVGIAREIASKFELDRQSVRNKTASDLISSIATWGVKKTKNILSLKSWSVPIDMNQCNRLITNYYMLLTRPHSNPTASLSPEFIYCRVRTGELKMEKIAVHWAPLLQWKSWTAKQHMQY